MGEADGVGSRSRGGVGQEIWWETAGSQLACFFLFDGKFDHLRIRRIPRIPRSRICRTNALVSGLSEI